MEREMRVVNSQEIPPARFSVYKFERVDIDGEEKFENPQLLFSGESGLADTLFGWAIARSVNKKAVGGETILFALSKEDEAQFPKGWNEGDL